MKSTINLLPKEVLIKSDTQQLASKLTKVAIAITAIFVLFVAGLVAFMIFVNNQLATTQDKIAQTKNQIRALESTEQSMLLVKDRVQKIQLIQNLNSSATQITDLDALLTALPASVLFQSGKLDVDRSRVTLKLTSSQDLAFVFNLVRELDRYQTVVMKKFDFNPAAGYQIEFETY